MGKLSAFGLRGRWVRLGAIGQVVLVAVAAGAAVVPAGAADSGLAAPVAPTPVEGIAVAPNTLIALQQARATDSSVIVANETTKTTTVYANPDQTFTSTVADGPVQEPNASSPTGFVPIDLTLKQQISGSWQPTVADADVSISSGGSATPVTMAVGQHQLSMKWATALPAPTVSGSTATYKNVAPGVDLVVQALTSGFDLRIVLTQRPSAASSYRIPLALTGLSAALSSTGRLQFQSGGSTQVVADRPLMYDSSLDDAGNPAHVAVVPTSISTTSGTALVVSPQSSFLSDPSTQYPVTIDPAPNLSATIDTFVNQGSPTTTYAGSTLLKAGKSSAEGPDRSLLLFDTSSLVGASVSAASLNLYESSANSCTANGLEVWDVASSWGSSVNWNTQPAKSAKWASANTSAGGGTGCPSAYVTFSTGGTGSNTIKGLVQAWANQTRTNNGVMVVASSETNTAYFKKFSSNEAGSNAPYLAVTYNIPPGVVTNRLPNNAGWVTSTTPTLSGTFNDADTGTVGQNQFELDTNAGSVIDTKYGNSVPAGSTSSWQVLGSDGLTNGTTYKWKVRGYDGTDPGTYSGFRTFTVDTTAPGTPSITSSTHPNPAQWYSGMSFTGSWSAVTDTISGVAGYAVKVDQSPSTVPGGALQTSTTYSKTVGYTGIYYLHVRAQDNAGNWGTTTTFEFNVGSGGLLSPNPGDRTQRYVTIQVAAGSGLTGATLQYRRSPFDTWSNIPASDVVDSDNNNASITWPVPITSGNTHHLRWDAQSTLGSVDGPVMVRSMFSPGSPSPSTGITISLEQNFFGTGFSQGDALSQVGPGQVNLLTGDYTLSATDANVGGLAVDRSFDSTMPNAQAAGVFGPGWSSSLNLGTYQRLHSGADSSQGDFVVVYGADGTEYGFLFNQAGTGYIETPDASGMTLSNPSGTFVLTDGTGAETTFTKPTGSTDYYPSSIVTPNSGATAAATMSISYAVVGGITRPTQEVAPPPSGVDCSTSPLTTRGCQTLSFAYATSTTGTSTCSSAFGDFSTQLKTISYTAWDPGGSVMSTVLVAGYSYDSNGRLRATCDPRISPILATTYAYDSSWRVSNVTPPGLSGWTLNYDSSSHITSASRPNDPSGTQTTSVVYGVPLYGNGAPYSMGAPAGQTNPVSQWGQQDFPTQATAVFPPDEVPSGSPPADYNYATVYYMDTNGNVVNTAEPGGSITTSEFDQNGNLSRELSAQNRSDALASGDSVSFSLSHDTEYIYDATGIQLVRELGPDRQVALGDGTVTEARQDIQYTYDTGSPNLVTKETEGALVDNASSDVDVRTTNYDYSGQSGLGYTLSSPTSVTVDPGTGNLNLTTTTKYDSLGHVIATIMPAHPAGGDAHETDTTYYRAGTGSGVAACDSHPEWDGLVCQSGPAAQPGTSGYPDIPVTSYTYGMWGNVATTTETVGSSVKTTTDTYETAAATACATTCTTDRLATEAVTGPGATLPTVTYSYEPSTGLPKTLSRVTGGVTATITTVYDQDGRMKSYTDADSNQSTYAYDISGRPTSITDGKGTQTLSYNQGSEKRGLLTTLSDSQAGAFTAAYDANGALVSETYPNGMTATSTIDPTGAVTAIKYVKTTNCSSACTWFADQATSSAHDQWLSQSSTLSGQSYVYDASGRLTWVYDTLGNQCVTRQYAYDADSNRTSLTNRSANSDGTCNTTAGGTVSSSTYDAADRATNAGYVFDTMGRITTVPAADAGGSTASVSYYVNDMVDSVTENSSTETTALDPANRIRALASAQTQTYHYSSSADSPSWIAENTGGTAWTRNVSGPDGVVAIADQTGSAMLQISDLHGDIIAEATTSAVATSLADTFEPTEFGQPRAGQMARRYGWLGSYSRARDSLSGFTFMGVRLYNPSSGRFLQTDPLAGGSANSYDYAAQDPIGSRDLGGTTNCGPGSSSLWSKLMGQTLFGTLFGSACDYHDACYTWWGTYRSLCDHNFFHRLEHLCSESYIIYTGDWYECHRQAEAGRAVVVAFGWTSFMGGFTHGGQIGTCKRRSKWTTYSGYDYLAKYDPAHAVYDSCFYLAYKRSDVADAWVLSPYGGWPR